MADVILHDISHEERREVDAYDGIDKIEPVGIGLVERAGEKSHNLVDDAMQHKGSDRGEQTNEEGEKEHEGPFAYVFLTSAAEPSEYSHVFLSYFFHAHFLIISTSPPCPRRMMLDGLCGLCSCRRVQHT